ncbi:glycerophosphodiester phosphodiesterase domain-containing protein 5-like isoform X2 [Lineus longissimus]
MQKAPTRRQGLHGCCSSLLGGIYGCRWKKHVPPPSTACDLIWFFLLLLFTAVITISLYLWLVIENDEANFNTYLHNKTGIRFRWYTLMLISTSIAFSYIALLLVLSLCHSVLKLQLYMHHVNRVFLVLLTLLFGGIMVVVGVMEKQEWQLVRLSLHMTGPFLQVAAVVLATILTWLFVVRWVKLTVAALRAFLLVLYISFMMFLYLSPLLISAPCICHDNEVPVKPKLFAHRGASMVAPENTMAAFEYAIENGCYGLESDVGITLDGVPVMLHDTTLGRTTNVADVFPGRVDDPIWRFTADEVSLLSAGQWFLDQDPYHQVSKLTKKQKRQYRKQTVPTLAEFLTFAKSHKTRIMFDIKVYNENGTVLKKVLETVKDSRIPRKNVYWIKTDNKTLARSTLVASTFSSPRVRHLRDNKYSVINVRYDVLKESTIREYSESNIETIIYIVNTDWLYSFYWCLGVDYVTTDNVDELRKMQSPIWHIQPLTYLIMWVTVDVVSVLLVIIIWSTYIYRQYKSNVPLESIPLEHANLNFTKAKRYVIDDADNSWMDSFKERKSLTRL